VGGSLLERGGDVGVGLLRREGQVTCSFLGVPRGSRESPVRLSSLRPGRPVVHRRREQRVDEADLVSGYLEDAGARGQDQLVPHPIGIRRPGHHERNGRTREHRCEQKDLAGRRRQPAEPFPQEIPQVFWDGELPAQLDLAPRLPERAAELEREGVPRERRTRPSVGIVRSIGILWRSSSRSSSRPMAVIRTRSSPSSGKARRRSPVAGNSGGSGLGTNAQ
jgi:hypothetical protein